MWSGGTSGRAAAGAGWPGRVGRSGRPRSWPLPPCRSGVGKTGALGEKFFSGAVVALLGGDVEEPLWERCIPFSVWAACDFPDPPSYLRGAHRLPPGRPPFFLFLTFLSFRAVLGCECLRYPRSAWWVSHASAVPFREEGTTFAGSGLGHFGRVLQVVLKVKEGVS